MTLTKQFDEALQKVNQQRQENFGHPFDGFMQAQEMMAVVASCPNVQVRHALQMICVKMSRLIHEPSHLDSLIDIAGYARAATMCLQVENEEKNQPANRQDCSNCRHTLVPLTNEPCRSCTLGPIVPFAIKTNNWEGGEQNEGQEKGRQG